MTDKVHATWNAHSNVDITTIVRLFLLVVCKYDDELLDDFKSNDIAVMKCLKQELIGEISGNFCVSTKSDQKKTLTCTYLVTCSKTAEVLDDVINIILDNFYNIKK